MPLTSRSSEPRHAASDGRREGSQDPRAVAARRVSAYAIGLLVVAGGACCWLLVDGARLPPFGAYVVLALPLAVCMNRFVFFPNEVGATAEAAALFAAIVGFRSESPLLGPVLLALLVGVLDGRHWERRAFLRMSYNSGSQALTVLAAAYAFGAVATGAGSSAAALVPAFLLATVVYVAVETGCGVVLVVLLGEPASAAFRHQLPVNALALPLGCFGAVIALRVAPDWWLVALALVPTAFVPELVLVGMRRAAARRRVRAALALASCALVVLVADLLAPGPGLEALVGVVALALVLGADCRPPLRRCFPPAAVLVAAATAGLASAGWLVVVCAVVAAAVATIAAGARPAEALWSLPLTLAAATVATVVGSTALAPGLLLVVGVSSVVAAASAWGSLPWASRVFSPWAARRARWWPLALVVGTSVLALLSSAWCLVTGATLAKHVAVAASAATLACATAGVRQWRFAPAARRRDATVLALGGFVVAALLVPDVAGSARVVAAGCATALALALGVAIGCVASLRTASRDLDGPSRDPTRVR